MKTFLKFLPIAILSFVIYGCGGGNGNDTTPQTNDITTGLIAYYPFNGNSDDESGNSNNGTVNGPLLTEDKNGNTNSAYLFDGLDDFISIPVNINPSSHQKLTVTALVRVDMDTTFNVVISHDDGGFDRTVLVDFRGGGSGWSAFSGSGEVLGFKPVVVGEWVSIAAVYDQQAETVKLYVNNSVFEEAGLLGEGLIITTIGSNPTFSSFLGGFFNGAIDEIRIYNRALMTQAEIQEVFNL